MKSAERKVALVCPTTLDFMPYVDNYEKVLKKIGIDYDLVMWDRFGSSQLFCNASVFRDSKTGHKRNAYDYFRYSRYVVSKVDPKRYSGVIVFGLQLAFFLQRFLLSKFKSRFAVDVRDHNRILNFYGLSNVLRSSRFVAISSPGYLKWMPQGGDVVVNHNTNISDLSNLSPVISFNETSNVKISCIGALRDLDANLALISSLENVHDVELGFHGQGDINASIERYVIDRNIANVALTGKYDRSHEMDLYKAGDFINVVRYADGINNETALPNRLYNSAIAGRPMLALTGTYLSDVVEGESIGLVVDSFESIRKHIFEYIRFFDPVVFDGNRRRFLLRVIEENRLFEDAVERFCTQ